MKSLRTDRTRWLEILAVLATALGKFLFMDYLNWRFPFVIAAIVLWSTYIIYQYRKQRDVLSHWGFTRNNFGKVVRMLLPFGLVAVVSFVFIGIYQGTINITWHVIPILLTYPIWGTIQQFLLIALVGGNLQDLEKNRMNLHLIVISAAVIFALVHYPYYWLMGGTFLLAILYGYIYMRARNLYVLGLFHGILAALFYYTVLDQDPFLNTFGTLLNLT